MQRIKILGICIVAVCALSAIAATAASAKRTWWVESKQLAVNVTKEITGKIKAGTEAKLETEVGGKKLIIKCKEAKLSKGLIFNSEPESGKVTGWDKGVIEFTKCETEPLKCTVTEPIRVPPLATSGETVIVEGTAKKGEKGDPLYDDFLPEETGSLKERIFAEIKLTGSLCPTSIIVKTELALGRQGHAKEGEGGALGEIEKAEENEKIHILKFVCPVTVTNVFNWKGEEVKVNALKVGTAAACFSAETEAELISKEKWEVR